MANEIITKAVTDQVAEAVVEEAIKQEVAKLPSKVSLNIKAVAAGAGIALSFVGLGIGVFQLVKVVKKSRAERKASEAAKEDPES